MQVVHAGDIRCELFVMSLIVRPEPEEEAIAMAHSDQLKGMMLFQFNPHLGRCNVNMFQLFYGKMASNHLRENGFKPATTTCIGKNIIFFLSRRCGWKHVLGNMAWHALSSMFAIANLHSAG